MFVTLHVKDKPVKVEIRMLEEPASIVSSFKDHPFELVVESVDSTWCAVGYLDKKELEKVFVQANSALQEHDRKQIEEEL